jgi:hypothetical protein
MHHMELLERLHRERQSLKTRLNEFHRWLVSVDETRPCQRCFSLIRSQLDEHIIEFRRFYAQLRTQRHSFETNITSCSHVKQLFDDNDKQTCQSIDESFQRFEQQTYDYNERINRFSACLQQYHAEHAHLIDHYAKHLRFYSEQVENNGDAHFLTLQLLLKNDHTLMIDHGKYEDLREELLQTNTIDNVDEIDRYDRQLNQYREEYQRFVHDLKRILRHRQTQFNDYESLEEQFEQWLERAEHLLEQTFDIVRCKQICDEYSRLPFDRLQSLGKQLTQYYSSANLLDVYEQLKGTRVLQTTTVDCQSSAIIDRCHRTNERVRQWLNIGVLLEQHETHRRTAQTLVEQIQQCVQLNENLLLPLNKNELDDIRQTYQVDLVR